eukprot:GHVT01086699.1.p1 GENE.GHVT01086699.1~~GHVT01086699.1.p1  ORF type:complete len:400 (-),score=86.98 GHVT01086699.1:410-1504(-)
MPDRNALGDTRGPGALQAAHAPSLPQRQAAVASRSQGDESRHGLTKQTRQRMHTGAGGVPEYEPGRASSRSSAEDVTAPPRVQLREQAPKSSAAQSKLTRAKSVPAFGGAPGRPALAAQRPMRAPPLPGFRRQSELAGASGSTSNLPAARRCGGRARLSRVLPPAVVTGSVPTTSTVAGEACVEKAVLICSASSSTLTTPVSSAASTSTTTPAGRPPTTQFNSFTVGPSASHAVFFSHSESPPLLAASRLPPPSSAPGYAPIPTTQRQPATQKLGDSSNKRQLEARRLRRISSSAALRAARRPPTSSSASTTAAAHALYTSGQPVDTDEPPPPTAQARAADEGPNSEKKNKLTNDSRAQISNSL